MTKYVVALTTDIPAGERKLVQVRGLPVAVFNLSGEYFAMHDKCPHRGGSLSAGVLTGLVESGEVGNFRICRQGEIVRCPWHGWEFDIRTGRSYLRPNQVRSRQFPVSVESGEQVVDDDALSLDMFPVAVDGRYIVIEA